MIEIISHRQGSILNHNHGTENGQHDSIEVLAQSCGISNRSIFRLFKKYIGVTPHAYRQRLQMEKARYLLKNTSESIKEIAEKLGFRTAFYFSSVFSRSVGVSPSDYRKKQSGGNLG